MTKVLNQNIDQLLSKLNLTLPVNIAKNES